MPVLLVWNNGYAVVQSVQFSFLPQSSCTGIGWILTHRQTHSFRALAPFQVVGAFWVSLFHAIYEHDIGLATTVRGTHNSAIPHSVRGLHSFREIPGVP